MIQKKLLWLDDVRNPIGDVDWLVFSPIGRDVDVIWVKSYSEFVEYIKNNDIPDGICFDHDLGDDKTGYDAVNWLIEYCLNNGCNFPPANFQTANPVGRENMIVKIENFKKLNV